MSKNTKKEKAQLQIGNDYNRQSLVPRQMPKNLGKVSRSFAVPGMTANGEQGRSMVEMLGTLAIMGVLSAGAIGGYSYAMNKHRTNELIYEATKRAQWVGTQLELGSEPSLNTFGTDSFGFGSFSGIDNNLPNANQFGIQVSGLNKSVCDNLLNNLDRSGVIRDVTNVDCQAGTATLVFNRDLSTSDSEITPDEPEVSGEVSEQATETANPETVPSDRKVHCNDHGEWDGNACDCDAGYDGETCSIEINAQPDEPEEIEDHTCSGRGVWIVSSDNPNSGSCSCDSGWGGSDCSQEDHTCSGHGTWYAYLNNGAGGCWCDLNWGGSDCSEDHTNDCSGHGFWCGGRCDCDSGWGGSDCSEDKSNACSGHGYWYQSNNNYTGGCNCNSGWGGSDCSDGSARERCSNHGYLNGTTCTCDSGWGGSDCSISKSCSGHGTWYAYLNNGAGGCNCNSGWGGSNCSQDLRAVCNNNGTWCGSFCNCDSGWGGSDCSIQNPCNENSGHGRWCGSFCSCNSGWGGSDCSVDKCSGHGSWIVSTGIEGGYCDCEPDWGGDDCSISQ